MDFAFSGWAMSAHIVREKGDFNGLKVSAVCFNYGVRGIAVARPDQNIEKIGHFLQI